MSQPALGTAGAGWYYGYPWQVVDQAFAVQRGLVVSTTLRDDYRTPPADNPDGAPRHAPPDSRIRLEHFQRCRAKEQKFAMLTAYDFPTAVCAQAAGVPTLLIGDSMGCVLLGHASTRGVPLDLMVILGEAVRRGAPDVYLVGDLPYESLSRGDEIACAGARRFVEEAGCDAVKIEAGPEHLLLINKLRDAGIGTIAHLGLRPQSVVTPDGYRAQARDQQAIEELTITARRMVDAGAVMLLLEAVPSQAAAAVVANVSVPVIGCGAGAACHGHVCVTQDLLGLGTTRPPRFVPVHANIGATMVDAMRRWVADIESGAYPAAKHGYGMKAPPTA